MMDASNVVYKCFPNLEKFPRGGHVTSKGGIGCFHYINIYIKLGHLGVQIFGRLQQQP